MFSIHFSTKFPVKVVRRNGHLTGHATRLKQSSKKFDVNLSGESKMLCELEQSYKE